MRLRLQHRPSVVTSIRSNFDLYEVLLLLQIEDVCRAMQWLEATRVWLKNVISWLYSTLSIACNLLSTDSRCGEDHEKMTDKDEMDVWG